MMQADIPLQAATFTDDFVDIAALNSHVSSQLLSRLEDVRRAALGGECPPSRAFVVLGPSGGGKTHLFTRLWHQAGPRATFLLLRPYFGVSLTPRDVAAAVIDQLCRSARGANLPHLDLIVAHWLSSDEGGSADEGSFPSAEVDRVRSMAPELREAHIERAIERIVEQLPELAPVAHLVRAFLGASALHGADRWAELAWLSGREPRSKVEGAPTLSEPDVMHMLRLVAALAAPVAPLALTFDQLENLAGEGDERVLAYGTLLSELVDSVPGLTILQLVLTGEWLEYIEPHLALPHKTRVASDKLLLEIPTRDERQLLLRAWHERFAPRGKNGRPPRYPRPLSEAQLEPLLSAPGMTPRLLLATFSRALGGRPWSDEIVPAAVARSALDKVFDEVKAGVREDLIAKEQSSAPVDATELAEGMAAALSFVPQLEVTTRRERERLFTAVKAPGHELIIVYLSSKHHASVAAALMRASEMAGSSKVAIVRERRLVIPASWASVNERRAVFEGQANARWLWLEAEDTVMHIALGRIFSQARAKRLRHPSSNEVMSLEALRAELATAWQPADWTSTAAIVRWLSDVPKGAAKVAAPPVAAGTEPERAPPSMDPRTMLREWLSMGRNVGRAAALHYFDKLRQLTRSRSGRS